MRIKQSMLKSSINSRKGSEEECVQICILKSNVLAVANPLDDAEKPCSDI